MDLRSLLVLLLVCLAVHLEGANAQYGSSPSNGAAGVAGAGYMVHQGYEEEEAPLLMGEEEKIKGEEGKKEEGRKEEKQDRPPQPVIPALTAEAWPETRNMSRSDRPCQPV
ncbi:hypothetical protein QYE76_003319 [Lolium multiflorum]|uniref:Uncharacterized protein n=1 Tax=Lolium multiflorum TaxID=4521 RepID=A0AAD8RQ12_LOLMU|nr:hypothetical protein QYE76_003319 [Lolium multiflorum]